MKNLFLFLPVLFLLASCQDAAIINHNPIVEQININSDSSKFKYEVKFKTITSERSAFMHTNFRYQVGDTLISYYEYFETKLKPVQDSLRIYTQKTKDLETELTNLKNYNVFLQEKLDKSTNNKTEIK